MTPDVSCVNGIKVPLSYAKKLWFAITQSAIFQVFWIAGIARWSAGQFKSGPSRVGHQ